VIAKKRIFFFRKIRLTNPSDPIPGSGTT